MNKQLMNYASRLFLCSLLLMVAGACSVTGSLRDDPKAGNFELGKLSGGWQQLGKERSGTADRVFENMKTNAFFSVNSVCERYPDASLESLTNQLLVPIQNFEVTKSEEIKIADRAALKKRVKGSLDGVAVESLIAVVRKNNCIFDFTLHARGHITDSDSNDFNTVLQGFRYE